MIATIASRAVDALNGVLGASLAAEEIYRTAITQIEHGERRAVALRVILQSHHANSALLRRTIRGLGGTPRASIGAWGVWARAVEGLAGLFGYRPAVRALREGEEHGARRAKEALDRLDPRTKRLVEGRLLPRFGEHRMLLDALLAPA